MCWKVGDKGAVFLDVYSGLSGLEEMIPEVKEYFKKAGVL